MTVVSPPQTPHPTIPSPAAAAPSGRANADEKVLPTLRPIPVLDVPVHDLSRERFVEAVEEMIRRPGSKVLAPVNVDILNQAVDNPRLRGFLQRASVVYADGSGVVLGARLAGGALPGRLTAADLIHDLCAQWCDGRFGIYFLGGPPGVAERAADSLCSSYPGTRIVGTWRGHLSPQEELDALADIAARRPDVLCVGFGTPHQEDFIERHAGALAHVSLIWPVGAMTTYIAGAVSRAPHWMRDNGLEWLYRLSLEPRRMFRRYVVGNPLFLARVVAWRMRRPNGG